MRTDGIIGNTHRHPYGTLLGDGTVRTAALHLHDPRLVGIADGEGLTLGVIAVLLHQCRHDTDSLTCRLGTLEGDIDQGSVVDDTRRVHHLLTATVGRLTDGHLPFVDIPHDIIGLQSLVNLSQVLVGVPLIDLSLVTFLVLGGRIMIQRHIRTIGVCIICADDGAVGTCLLAYHKIGTCFG